jgi:endonuclease-3
MTLSGVGRKTAVAVLANGFKKYVGIAVDTHVIRFATRFKLSSSKNPVQIEKDLMEIIPKKDWNAASYAIKEYGRKEGRARGYKPENDPVWKVFKSIKK